MSAWTLTIVETHSLLVRVHISDAKVIFLQQVEMVADEVKQVLTLCIPLRRQRTDKVEDAEDGGDTKAPSTLLISPYLT